MDKKFKIFFSGNKKKILNKKMDKNHKINKSIKHK